MCTVYLIHLDRPLRHARHYLGYTCLDSVEQRLQRHKNGTGARILKYCNEVGISYEIVRTWNCNNMYTARKLERKLKKQHNSKHLCPVCKEAHK